MYLNNLNSLIGYESNISILTSYNFFNYKNKLKFINKLNDCISDFALSIRDVIFELYYYNDRKFIFDFLSDLFNIHIGFIKDIISRIQSQTSFSIFRMSVLEKYESNHYYINTVDEEDYYQAIVKQKEDTEKLIEYIIRLLESSSGTKGGYGIGLI